MTPEQARNVQRGAATMAAYLRGDHEALDLLVFDRIDEDPPPPEVVEQIDGLVALCVATGQVLASLRQVPLDQALDELPAREQDVLGRPIPHWPDVVDNVKRVSRGDVPATTEALDTPTVLTAAWAIAQTLVEECASRLSKSPADTARLMAEAAALET